MSLSIGFFACLFAPEAFVIAKAIEGKMSLAISWGVLVNTSWVLLGYLFWTIIVIGGNRLLKRFLVDSHNNNGFMKFLGEKLEKTLKNKEGQARKVVAFASNHKYGLLFSLNLIPFMPYISTATILSLKLSGVSSFVGLLVILMGGSTKILLLATITRLLCSL